MAITRAWRAYGVQGHRQKEAFNASYRWDFSEGGEGGRTRIIEVCNADITGTHDYSLVAITRDSAQECADELDGQITDGIFENSRVGDIVEVELI